MALKSVFRVRQMSQSFFHQPIFDDLNFDIYQGERIALLGPSGSGKTLLLKTLAGLFKPQTGQLSFFDVERERKNLDEQRKQMGLVFQKNALFDDKTALENLSFTFYEGHGYPSPSVVLEQTLASVELIHAQHLKPNEMSGGMQKRLAIARAHVLNPSVLLYDDPTAGLDPITSRKIIEVMVTLQKNNGSTLVVVTNEIARAYQVATRLFYLDQGKLWDLGTPEQARTQVNTPAARFLAGQGAPL